jgi:hypothetical protein
MSLLILTNPPAVPHRILLHLRTRAKAILPRPTKRNLLPPIHLRISLPTKVKVQPNPTSPRTSLRTSPLTKNPLNLTAVLLTDHDLRLRTNPIVNPPHHTNPNPTASLLPLTGPHPNPHPNLTVNHHLPPNHPGAVLLLIRVRREVLPPGLPVLALPGPALRRALLRKKSKCTNSCKAI